MAVLHLDRQSSVKIVRVDFHPAGFGRACKKSILAMNLQNDWSKNLFIPDTPPTPERIPGALKPFTDHNLITTLMLPKILPAFVYFLLSPSISADAKYRHSFQLNPYSFPPVDI
jgi:hypothetical protein